MNHENIFYQMTARIQDYNIQCQVGGASVLFRDRWAARGGGDSYCNETAMCRCIRRNEGMKLTDLFIHYIPWQAYWTQSFGPIRHLKGWWRQLGINLLLAQTAIDMAKDLLQTAPLLIAHIRHHSTEHRKCSLDCQVGIEIQKSFRVFESLLPRHYKIDRPLIHILYDVFFPIVCRLAVGCECCSEAGGSITESCLIQQLAIC